MSDISSPILSTNGPFIQVKATERVLQSLAQMNIFLGHGYTPATSGVTVLKPNFDKFWIAKDAKVEEYAQFIGTRITSRGSFSYAETPVHDFVCGRYCSIAANLTIMGERHPMEFVTSSGLTYCFKEDWFKPSFLQAQRGLFGGKYPRQMDRPSTKPIPQIGHDVWIGNNVILARGIHIGTGAVIAAGSVVTKDVPEYAVMGGNPAKFIKMRFPIEIAGGLLASRWWEYHPSILYECGFVQPEDFLRNFKRMQVEGTLPIWTLRTWTADEIIANIEASEAQS